MQYARARDHRAWCPLQQPAFARREVFRACAQTTLMLTAAGIALRLAAQPIANAVPIFDSSTVNALLASTLLVALG